ncbi:hypothetical protein Arub01_40510 [Actinomadura rubrobrunea]|uniref:Uncharacterized protein n=1 Tax=Actinomadura rubrobrunea TaxID=115335 RepID=A0A9W6UY15_9ACTN|nr:hypothetical protein Arub01_40510 [Actinomadura rubrobrunea]
MMGPAAPIARVTVLRAVLLLVLRVEPMAWDDRGVGAAVDATGQRHFDGAGGSGGVGKAAPRPARATDTADPGGVFGLLR